MCAPRLACGASLRLASLAVGAFALIVMPESLSAQQKDGGNQLPLPRITSIFPCGAKAGTSVEVTLIGTDVEDAESLHFSHPGIKAEAVMAPPPPPDPKKKPDPKMKGPKPTVLKWKINVPADAPLGNHDLRIVNKYGISNARTFVVGDLNEVMEKEPNNDVPEAQRVEMNTTVNGAISAPTDVDYYVFAGKKGQRVVISCVTSSIDSRMNAGIEVFDAADRRLAENRNYQGDDALTDVTLQADGDYYVRVFEFTHQQGNADHFYRLTITTGPWIDAVYPSSIEPGKAAQVTVYGRNLPGGKLDPTAIVGGRVLETLGVTINATNDPAALSRLTYSGRISPPMAGLDGFEYRLKGPGGSSNPYLLTYARAPVVLDNEKNDTLETVQVVTPPCEIVGRFEKKRDRDWYAFNAKKGDVYSIEGFSDRIGAPTDLAFSLMQLSAKATLGDFDDNPETLGNKFFTRSNDPPRYRFEVKDDKGTGRYELMVRSQDGDVSAGPRHIYRLVIAPEKPDFHLIVMPADGIRPDAGQLYKGGNMYINALVWRHDNFNGPVAVSVEGLPAGVTCAPQVIGPGQREVALVLSAAPTANTGIAELKFKGTALVNGKSEVREGRPASITWAVPPQQNVPTLSRLERSFMLAVCDNAPFNLTATIDNANLKPGDKANLTVKLTRLWPDFKANLAVSAMDMPLINNQPNQPGITINNNQPIQLAPGKDEFKAVVEVKPNMGPGTFNLVLKGVAQVPYNKDPMAKQKPNINIIQPSTPVSLTIIPKQLATFTVAAPNVNLKQGTNAEVVVKVARLFDYDGEFKVKLMLPPNAAGVSVDEVTIPAGATEAKLVIKATTDAAVANLANLVVQATAMYEGKVPTVHETKLTVNVVKK
ncbi:hypothetical protein AYO40_03355 [Planctomycetaceae bacterium SCGC AG-212-D15]|nr:hypothetical protein AYO40_03355 [Planctomycetaceae bacterium SCGC AG-212-D15]